MNQKNFYRLMMLLLVIMTFSGCGFGGLTDTSTAAETLAATEKNREISGVVSKGLFSSGTVEIYRVDSSGEETLLKTATIKGFGNYSATVKLPKDGAGVLLLKAYGSYLDEATGAERVITKFSPLRAALASPTGDTVAMVTPMTELAVRKAVTTGDTLTAAEVSAANSMVSELYKVDIISTEPVRPDLSDGGFGNAATSQEQRDYTLALAAVSQLASDTGNLANALETMFKSVATGGESAAGAEAFKTSLIKFLASNRNQTGVTDLSQTNLAYAGGSNREVKLSLGGKLNAGVTMNGISLTVNLPPGVIVKGDYENQVVEPLAGVVRASGVAAASTYVEARYFPASGSTPGRVQISLANGGGFYFGEFITITCEVQPGSSPQPATFTISDFVAKDGNGAVLSNVDVISPPTVQ